MKPWPLYGQPRAAGLIESFLRKPVPRAFLLSGPTGTGKTTTAHYLAESLGIDREILRNPELLPN